LATFGALVAMSGCEQANALNHLYRFSFLDSRLATFTVNPAEAGIQEHLSHECERTPLHQK
jgi:hypothetical protein